MLKICVTEVPKRAMDCPFASITTVPIDLIRDDAKEIAKKAARFQWKCTVWGGRCSLDMPEYFEGCNRLVSFEECMRKENL